MSLLRRRMMLRADTAMKNGFIDGSYSGGGAITAVVSNGNHIALSTPDSYSAISVPFISSIQIHDGDVIGISFSAKPYLDSWSWNSLSLIDGQNQSLDIWSNQRGISANRVYSVTATSDFTAELLRFRVLSMAGQDTTETRDFDVAMFLNGEQLFKG